MQHAIIIDKPNNSQGKYLEVALTEDRKIYLAKADYSQEELEAFDLEAKNWILQCSGSKCFYADYDSGEDATGCYCEYFDLTAQTAIFDNGRFVGFYVCCDGFRYSGNGRASFSIDQWNFYDPFFYQSKASDTHIVLFSQEKTHSWENWKLLRRDPDTKYVPYLSF